MCKIFACWLIKTCDTSFPNAADKVLYQESEVYITMLLNLPKSGKGGITQASFLAQPSVFMEQCFVLCSVK